MERIKLLNILPHIFAKRNDITSAVWKKEIDFVKGEKYLIEANSGTGKSSLGSYIFGYRNDYSGEIFFDNTNIRDLSSKDWNKIRKNEIAFLWQELRLFSELSAMENVEIKNKLTGYCSKKQINEWFETLGILDKVNIPICKLSFGQQQRVALIRTLCQPCDFIFIDEPVSHLDDSNCNIIGELISNEIQKRGSGLIVTSIGKRVPIRYDNIYRL